MLRFTSSASLSLSLSLCARTGIYQPIRLSGGSVFELQHSTAGSSRRNGGFLHPLLKI